MFGFINLDKPVGFTSHDCVAKIRKLLKTKKVGHGGTLDPSATGVLPIAVGKATRLFQFLPEKKAYCARISLGISTSTDDLDGEILSRKLANHISQEQVFSYLEKFQGEIEQTPPIYSAIKQNGKKLYEFARKGDYVEVLPRKVLIDKIEIIKFISGDFPELEIRVFCGPGTYIRVIARDLGNMLGVGGSLSHLVRLESCGMKLYESISFEEITQTLEDNSFTLISPDSVLSHLDSIFLNSEDSQRWCCGQKISCSNKEFADLNIAKDEKYFRMYQEGDIFLGIGVLENNEGGLFYKPKIVCK